MAIKVLTGDDFQRSSEPTPPNVLVVINRPRLMGWRKKLVGLFVTAEGCLPSFTSKPPGFFFLYKREA